MSRVEVEKKDLEHAVDLAMLASGRSCKDIALQNVLVRMASGQASVESYDTHIYSRATFSAKGQQGLEFAVEGVRLQHLVTAAEEGMITFEVDADGVKVLFGKASIQLRTFPLDKYVRIPITKEEVLATQVRSGILHQSIEFVRPFIGKDTQKPSAMLAELRNGRLMAGDGTRIGVVKFGSNGQPVEGEGATPAQHINFGLKVPQQVVSNISRWLKDLVDKEDEGLIDVSSTEEFYFFKTASGNILAWRKPEHDFMSIEQHLRKFEEEPSPSAFKVDKESITRMVDCVSVVLEAGAERVNFGINGNEMMPMLGATAMDSRGVPSKHEVQIITSGEKVTADFALRSSHILDTLKMINNPIVEVEVRSDTGVILIKEVAPEMQKTALLTLMQDA